MARTRSQKKRDERIRRVLLTIHDVAGRRVKTLVDGTVPAGRQGLLWKGTDDAGRAVASGTYYLRLQAEQGVRTGKLVLAK